MVTTISIDILSAFMKRRRITREFCPDFFPKESAKIKNLIMEECREKPSETTDENIESLQFVKINVRKDKLFSERLVICPKI